MRMFVCCIALRTLRVFSVCFVLKEMFAADPTNIYGKCMIYVECVWYVNKYYTYNVFITKMTIIMFSW